jgi:bleomycin hydrolase
MVKMFGGAQHFKLYLYFVVFLLLFNYNNHRMKKTGIILLLISLSFTLYSQENPKKDRVVFKESKNGFYQDSVLSSINNFKSLPDNQEAQKYISMDFSGEVFPTDTSSYTNFWHNHPLSQGRTGTCWSFASTSFIETEVFRITGQKTKLSELYNVYWEYVERAKYFVRTRGEMSFGEGSEANAVPRLMKLYGALPAGSYSGKLFGQKVHDHEALFTELDSYLKKVKENKAWNEEYVVSTVKQILNHYLGEPPSKAIVNGSDFNPKEYLEKVLQIKPQDYFSFMSTKSQTYNQKGELMEPDNWWHSDDYYNIRLEDFLDIAIDALGSGYSLCVCGDVSEPGYDKYSKVGVIPTFDIPASYIDEDSREYRLNNQITYDDHCLHIVGFQVKDGKTWFMIKDSGSGGFDAAPRGYRFINEDYFRLKVITVMVHKLAAKKVLDKIIK